MEADGIPERPYILIQLSSLGGVSAIINSLIDTWAEILVISLEIANKLNLMLLQQ